MLLYLWMIFRILLPVTWQSTLSGMVNGLSVSGGDARPGENARINIRQNDVLSDIGGTASEPLYVIDGYIYPVEVKIGDVTENLEQLHLIIWIRL